MVKIVSVTKKIVILLVIGTSSSILLMNCRTEHYLIKDFRFYGAKLMNHNATGKNLEKEFINVDDTLIDRLYFSIESWAEYYRSYINYISLNSTVHAINLPAVIDNDIVLESLELKLDSDIYFESDTIKKGTDLWHHPQIRNYIWFDRIADNNLDVFYRAIIGFTDVFYDKVFMPPQRYTIELTCTTTDNLRIVRTIELFIKL